VQQLRVVAYAPQVLKAASDKDGAKAISPLVLFLIAHLSGAAYASLNQRDWTMTSLFLGNAADSAASLFTAGFRRLRHSVCCRVGAIARAPANP
jgi:hypothetical protein